MPLYLTGGGDQQCFHSLDKLFAENMPHGARILAIPLAVDPEEYDDVLERAEDCFSSKKIEEIALCPELDKLTEDELNEYDAVFIEGGNTFQLVKVVRQSPIFDLLEAFLADGKSIYADSAGAIILGTSVKTAFLGEEADEDLNRLQDFRGLGLLEDWTVHCHYELDESDDLNSLLYDEGYPIICIPEPCAVFIDGDTLRVYGKGSVDLITFTGQTSLKSGESIELSKAISAAS